MIETVANFLDNNETLFVAWENKLPGLSLDGSVHLHGKNSKLTVPLTDAPSLVALLRVTLHDKVIFTYDIKDLITLLRYQLKKSCWKEDFRLPGKFFDIRYLELFSGVDAKVPQNLSEAISRFKKCYNHKAIKIHGEIHTPLAHYVLPSIELTPLIKKGFGHVYSHYHIEGSRNGRLSCDKPTQEFFLPHTLTPEDKKSLSAGENRVLMTADFHAMEVAVLEAITGDANLKAALESGDAYSGVYKQLSGQECTPEGRQMIKGVLLPVLYGMQPYGLSKSLNISKESAENLFGEIHRQYGTASDYLLSAERAASDGKFTDFLGRGREYGDDFHAARCAAVQGPAAVVCLEKLIALHGVTTHATVHDGYILSCNKLDVDDTISKVKEILESPSKYIPGLKLNVQISK